MNVRGFFESARFCSLLVICPALLAVVLTGCEKNSEIKVYRVSKAPLEESASQQQDALPTNTAAPRMPGGLSPAAETGLDQLGQPPITEEKLGETAQRLRTSLGDIIVVDLAGLPKNADPARDGRIVAAMLSTADSTLFFKMRGNADLTEAQKGDFIKWVAAVCNAQTETRSPQMPAMPTEEVAAPRIKWETPEGWTEVPPSSMRYASFSASAENGDKIDISVVTFAGDGGSDADNVNRWRGQIGLAPADEKTVNSQITALKTADTTFATTDIASAKARTIAAWTRRDGHVWFFKATGPSAAVEKEKPKFVKFIESVRF